MISAEHQFRRPTHLPKEVRHPPTNPHAAWRGRLRIVDYRVFYDVGENEVVVIAVLHKRETAGFYREETP